MHTVGATATRGGPGAAQHHACSTRFARTSFQSGAGTHSALVEDAPGAQCAKGSVWSGKDNAVRCFPHFRGISGTDERGGVPQRCEPLPATMRTKNKQGRGTV